MTEQKENQPLFFSNDFFSTLLQEGNSKHINVISFRAVPAVAAGNNYCCVVYRVHVEYEADNEATATSFIVKTPLADGKAKEMISEMGVIAKECAIYSEVVPLMDAAITTKITPKHYHCTVPDTVILEDLKDLGYIMCDRLKQLDFDHCNMFMKTIAIFHATSVHIHKENPELIERVGEERVYTAEMRPDFKKYIEESSIKFADILEEWGEFDDFADLYRNHRDELSNRVTVVHNTKRHWRVLNHGDAWTNNMLFKHDDTGNVVDMKLIDLQICKFASPALDLILFITSSAQEDVKEHRLPELYTTYLEYFNSTLESLDCDERLTADELQDELKFAECFGLCLMLGFVAMVLNERDNTMDMNKVLDALLEKKDETEVNPLFKAFNGKKFKEVAKFTLRKLREQHVLSSLL